MESGNQRGRLFFYILFILLGILTFYLISPYIGAILLAFVTVILLKPPFNYFMRKKWINGRSRIATTVTLVTFILAIIIPLLLIGWLIFAQLSNAAEELSSTGVENSLTELVAEVEAFIQQFPSQENFTLNEEQFIQILKDVSKAILDWLSQLAISLGTSLPALFIGLMIYLIVIATLLPRTDDFIERIQELSPLEVSISQIYGRKAEAMVVSVVKGVFLLALLQGLIMGLFYWLAGIPFAAFWTIVSMAFAILPVVGISFIVLPLAVLSVISGNVTTALILLFGFYVIVNPLDIILRPRLVSKEAYLNFTLMLMALFGGMAMAGLLGMIYGPVIMILFLTTLDIYTEYYAERKESPEIALVDGDSDTLPEDQPLEADASPT